MPSRRSTLFVLLERIEKKLRHSFPVTPPPGASWTVTRTFLEFLDFCLENDECRLELKNLYDRFNIAFYIAKAPSESVRAILLLLQREQKKDTMNKNVGKVSRKIPLDKIIHNE